MQEGKTKDENTWLTHKGLMGFISRHELPFCKPGFISKPFLFKESRLPETVATHIPSRESTLTAGCLFCICSNLTMREIIWKLLLNTNILLFLMHFLFLWFILLMWCYIHVQFSYTIMPCYLYFLECACVCSHMFFYLQMYIKEPTEQILYYLHAKEIIVNLGKIFEYRANYST